MTALLHRFLRYIAYDTRSNPDSLMRPSTAGQTVLLKLLAEELRTMGLDAAMDKNSNVCVHIPANNEKTVPAIGFFAHVDTATEVSGANVQPQIVEHYTGEDIVLNAEKNIVLRVGDFPVLNNYKGQTIITTDGTTLLGADDKAGVAVLMHLAEYLTEHPEIKHGAVHLAFTCDEEIGRGADGFDVKAFGADYAYTIDGGAIGELEYENFNAAQAVLTVQGSNMHPGEAGPTFKNALLLIEEFNRQLPADQRPENTKEYEGFFLLSRLSGTPDKAEAQYLIRDHSAELFAQKKALMQSMAQALNVEHGADTFQLKITDQYYNMRPEIEKNRQVVDKAIAAMKMAGVEPVVKPIRGGTDGARLTYMGLPCPNIFAGGHNFHSIYEFLPVQSMQKAFDTTLNLVILSDE